MERIELLNRFYGSFQEDERLDRSRHGQLEYLTTMHYIHRFLPETGSVLEIGAGTGRYSAALAREGHRVTAVELTEPNLAVLREKARSLEGLRALRGDAVDLGFLPKDSFDLTLVFGPMYHLYEREEQLAALGEAVRVTRPGGVLITAFLSVHAILYDNYLRKDFLEGLAENFDPEFRVRHFQEQLFTGFGIREFEELFQGLPVERLSTVAADGILELAEGRGDFQLSDEAFAAFTRYHLRHCEERELLGASAHLLHICQKKQ